MNGADKSQIRNLVLAMWIFEHKIKYLNANGRTIEQMSYVINEIVGDRYFND